jgi:hypothetical protein
MAAELGVPLQVQTHFLNCLDLYHNSPDSGERQCKSRAWKKNRKRRFDPNLIAAELGVPLQVQIAFLNGLDLYHKSPDSGERQYKSRACKGLLKKTI